MSEDVGRSSSPRRIMKRGSDSIISAVQDVGGAGAGTSEIKKVGALREVLAKGVDLDDDAGAGGADAKTSKKTLLLNRLCKIELARNIRLDS